MRPENRMGSHAERSEAWAFSILDFGFRIVERRLCTHPSGSLVRILGLSDCVGLPNAQSKIRNRTSPRLAKTLTVVTNCDQAQSPWLQIYTDYAPSPGLVEAYLASTPRWGEGDKLNNLS